MSAVIAADAAAAPPPAKAGKKKLIMIGAIALVLLLAIGGGVAFWLKHKAAKAAEAEAEDGGEHVVKVDPHFVPVFLPLDPFVVNLADKEADRFAQIGITLELENAASTERIKAYMPAVRNSILLLIAGKTSQMLGDRAGKEKLAQEIMREAVRPLGIEVPEPTPVTTLAVAPAGEAGSAPMAREGAPQEAEGHDAPPAKEAKGKKEKAAAAEDEEDGGDGEAPKAKSKGKKKGKDKDKDKAKSAHDADKSPIVHVHFSSFIIQ